MVVSFYFLCPVYTVNLRNVFAAGLLLLFTTVFVRCKTVKKLGPGISHMQAALVI